jgi:hypothetical protein
VEHQSHHFIPGHIPPQILENAEAQVFRHSIYVDSKIVYIVASGNALWTSHHFDL